MAEFTFDLAKFIPYRDREVCEKVRTIKREDITKHPNPQFKIRVIESSDEFYFEFALDIVTRIREALEEDKKLVLILPAGPIPQYRIAARLINELKISCRHVHTFNMDEYANEKGETAPESWSGSFKKSMVQNFFSLIDKDLRMPENQLHFPSNKNIEDYGKMIEDAGQIDVCYGGIGWCGHIAFWEAHLGEEFGDDIEAYKKANPRIVELHPMTIMQNALHSFSGDWSSVPPKAATIGPRQILRAKERSFWLDGYLGGGVSWQRFIARLVAYGPVNTLVPGTMLQTAPTTYTLLGGVADNCEISIK
jgi:glucosamine-6-phosphate deaminase